MGLSLNKYIFKLWCLCTFNTAKEQDVTDYKKYQDRFLSKAANTDVRNLIEL